MSRLHCDRLSTRHRKSGSEILKLDVGFLLPFGKLPFACLRSTQPAND
ncbi:MAG: hypothetical protein V7K88_26065 [Nostoc sp.]